VGERFAALVRGRFYFETGTTEGYVVVERGIAELGQREGGLGCNCITAEETERDEKKEDMKGEGDRGDILMRGIMDILQERMVGGRDEGATGMRREGLLFDGEFPIEDR